MGASLLDERDIALRGADSIHDEVARAPHGHEVAKSRENELPVLPLGEWSIRPIMIQRYLLAPPPAHRAPGRSRQHQAAAGMLREAGRRPGLTARPLCVTRMSRVTSSRDWPPDTWGKGRVIVCP